MQALRGAVGALQDLHPARLEPSVGCARGHRGRVLETSARTAGRRSEVREGCDGDRITVPQILKCERDHARRGLNSHQKYEVSGVSRRRREEFVCFLFTRKAQDRACVPVPVRHRARNAVVGLSLTNDVITVDLGEHPFDELSYARSVLEALVQDCVSDWVSLASSRFVAGSARPVQPPFDLGIHLGIFWRPNVGA